MNDRFDQRINSWNNCHDGCLIVEFVCFGFNYWSIGIWNSENLRRSDGCKYSTGVFFSNERILFFVNVESTEESSGCISRGEFSCRRSSVDYSNGEILRKYEFPTRFNFSSLSLDEDEEIELFHKKNHFVRKLSIRQALYCNRFLKFLPSIIDLILLDFGYMWNGQILIVVLNLGTLAYGGHLVMNNRLNVSSFVSFILYQQRLGDLLDVIRLILLKQAIFVVFSSRSMVFTPV